MTITSLKRKIESLNIENIALASLEETKEQIAKKNVEQMQAGLTASGSNITPPYTANTVRIKQRKGQVTSHVTLRDTGAFQDAVFTLVDNSKVITGSFDPKSEVLEKKYSGIFGLSSDFKNDYIRENLTPVFFKKMVEAGGLRFFIKIALK